MSDSGRTDNGQFAPGNPGGPGRPRRAVEAEYLGTLAEVVTLERWHEIVQAAVEQARGGDFRAREWVSKYVLGTGATLLDLAASEQAGLGVESEIAAKAKYLKLMDSLQR